MLDGRPLTPQTPGTAPGTATAATTTPSQWAMTWRAFRRHRLGMFGLVVLVMLYGATFLAGFIAPNSPGKRYSEFTFLTPQGIHFFDEGRLQAPFVYGYTRSRDPETFEAIYTLDHAVKIPVNFFVKGESYSLFGFRASLKLFQAEGQPIFLFGTDGLGRDIFSRTLFGGQISLTIGLVGVAVSLVLGVIIGGVSGFYGGWLDEIIQRFIEFLTAIPKLPLWMALAAALPLTWPTTRVYFAIVLVLSAVGWMGLARVVRGQVLSLKQEDYTVAATALGASNSRVIGRHILPNTLSYILVAITLAIPGMILGETSLSFLGLGLQPPAISWGVLLQDAQQVQVVADYPWLLLPGLFIVLAVLSFNFVGDGLRDAADPYK